MAWYEASLNRGGGSESIDLSTLTAITEVAFTDSYTVSPYSLWNNVTKGSLIIMTGDRSNYQAYPTNVVADGVDITNTSECRLTRPNTNSFDLIICPNKDYAQISITFNRTDRNLSGSIMYFKAP